MMQTFSKQSSFKINCYYFRYERIMEAWKKLQTVRTFLVTEKQCCNKTGTVKAVDAINIQILV